MLFEAPLAPLCAPEVAAYLTIPENLGREVLLRSYRSNEWPRWFAEAGATCPPMTGPMFDSSLAMAEIASDGGGVALLPVDMFTRHVCGWAARSAIFDGGDSRQLRPHMACGPAAHPRDGGISKDGCGRHQQG